MWIFVKVNRSIRPPFLITSQQFFQKYFGIDQRHCKVMSALMFSCVQQLVAYADRIVFLGIGSVCDVDNQPLEIVVKSKVFGQGKFRIFVPKWHFYVIWISCLLFFTPMCSFSGERCEECLIKVIMPVSVHRSSNRFFRHNTFKVSD